MAEFDFSVWASTSALVDVTVKRLKEECFDSLPALLNMTVEDITALSLGKQGLVRVLQGAVSKLQTAHGEGPMALQGSVLVDSGGSDKKDTGDILDSILSSVKKSTNDHSHVSTGRADLDPTVYLQKRDGKPLRIVDYCSIQGGTSNDEEVNLSDSVTVKIKGKLKLDNVSPAQWIAANSRICSELINKGKLEQNAIHDYLAYTAKIGELALRYTWQSVLLYDHQYRELQDAYGYRWGVDCPHLGTVCLRDRVPPKTSARSGVRGANGSSSTLSTPLTQREKPVCRQFNKGSCSYAERCNFQHVCSECRGNHPACDHDRDNANKNKSA